LKLIDRMDRK